jgi:beta-hydroxylase
MSAATGFSILLMATGLVVWVLIVLSLGLRVLGHRRVRRVLESRRLLPYWLFTWYRSIGVIGATLKKVGLSKTPTEIIAAHQAITLADMSSLRDVFTEMDRLPTIEKGKRALGLDTMFEMSTRNVPRIPSPYTHPMQYPPYLIPGVPARTFYDPNEFDWAPALLEAYPIIRDELMQLLARNAAGFKGYMSEGQERLAGWNTFNFFFYGKKYEENCALCPRTTAILESLPRFEKDHIMFSALNPHSRIPPHTGPMNGILRAHLGLVVPKGCFIRVGPDERTWEEGKLLVFDDSFEHEVFNHSDSVRIVLFMNFWHPCFSAREIEVLEKFRRAYERGPFSLVHAQNQAAKRAHDLEVKTAAGAGQAA